MNLQDPIAELEHGDDLAVAIDECRTLFPPSNPMAAARQLLAAWQHDSGALLRRYWRGSWMEWRRGVWVEVDDCTVRADAYRQTEHALYIQETDDGEELRPWTPTRRKIGDLLEAEAAVAHLSPSIQPPTWIDGASGAPQIVVCRNGTLSWQHDRCGRTTRGTSHRSRFPSTLTRMRRDRRAGTDSSNSSGRMIPMQFARSRNSWDTCCRGADLDKILLLIGPTRAGKGVIARVFGLLIGPGNVTGPTLASLSQNFELQDLIGKPLAVISDARLGHADTHQVVERLLAISGRDTITVDRKWRDPWTGQLPTRFMIISNELPRFGDASGAIANRFVVLALTKSWLGREDRELEAALAAELPGILNWALDGLDRLAERDRFTEPVSSVDAITALADLVSPVAAFVRDRCVRGAHLNVGCEELYADWKRWADDNGHRAGSTQTFGRDLRAVIPGLRVTRPREDENEHRQRRYGGIGRRVDPQSPRARTSADHETHGDRGPQWSADEAFVVRTPGRNGDREVVER